jgi:hypothetical protein
MVGAFGSIAVGDLFKNKDYEATYRLFNGMSSMWAIALIYVGGADLWSKSSIFVNTVSTICMVIGGLIFGHKAIESFKLAAKIRHDRLHEIEQE